MVGDQLAKTVKVEYVYQEYETLPAWYKVPEGRVKPFGTVHAVLCARDVIHEPFAVINADDYYGRAPLRHRGASASRASRRRAKPAWLAIISKTP